MFKSIKKKLVVFILLIAGIYTLIYASDNVLVESFSKIKTKILDEKMFNLGTLGIYVSTFIIPSAAGILYALSTLFKKDSSIITYAADIITWILCNGFSMAGVELLTKTGVVMPDISAILTSSEASKLLQVIGTNLGDINAITPAMITATPIATSIIIKIAAGLLKK